MNKADATSIDAIRPVREGLVSGTAGDPADIRLLGSRCVSCGEVSMGTNEVCLNCGSDRISGIELASEGELWTYTIIRHKPPVGYLGPEPFEPFALGLVELADGIRIVAPLDGDVDSFEIGARLRLKPWILRSPDGQQYRAFRFATFSS